MPKNRDRMQATRMHQRFINTSKLVARTVLVTNERLAGKLHETIPQPIVSNTRRMLHTIQPTHTGAQMLHRVACMLSHPAFHWHGTRCLQLKKMNVSHDQPVAELSLGCEGKCPVRTRCSSCARVRLWIKIVRMQSIWSRRVTEVCLWSTLCSQRVTGSVVADCFQTVAHFSSRNCTALEYASTAYLVS